MQLLMLLRHPLLEEVRLPLQADHVHPVKQVLAPEQRLVPQVREHPVRDELDILPHETGFHPDQAHREGVAPPPV